MNVNLEWVLSALISVIIILIGTLFKMSLTNRSRLERHDILFATLTEGVKKIDDVNDSVNSRFDKHEEKEDRILSDIIRKLERLTINVALIKKSPNGDKENA